VLSCGRWRTDAPPSCRIAAGDDEARIRLPIRSLGLHWWNRIFKPADHPIAGAQSMTGRNASVPAPDARSEMHKMRDYQMTVFPEIQVSCAQMPDVRCRRNIPQLCDCRRYFLERPNRSNDRMQRSLSAAIQRGWSVFGHKQGMHGIPVQRAVADPSCTPDAAEHVCSYSCELK
jgi:hypothetical protein